MNLLISFLMSLIVFISTPWETSMDAAIQKAKTENKLILLNFSGSDWCGPCIKLKKEVLDSPDFLKFSENKLVLVRADFPRKKSNRLSEVKTQENEKLAERYNAKGKFPFTVLIDANGKVLKEWDGYEKGITANTLFNQISAFIK